MFVSSFRSSLLGSASPRALTLGFAALALPLALSSPSSAQVAIQPTGGGAPPSGCSAITPDVAFLCSSGGGITGPISFEIVTGTGPANSSARSLTVGTSGGVTTNVTSTAGRAVNLVNTTATISSTNLTIDTQGAVSESANNSAAIYLERTGHGEAYFINRGSITATGTGSHGIQLLGTATGTGNQDFNAVNLGTVTATDGHALQLEIQNGNTNHYATINNQGTMTGGVNSSAVQIRLLDQTSSQRIVFSQATNGTINNRSTAAGSRSGVEIIQNGSGLVLFQQSGTIDAQTGANQGRGVYIAANASTSNGDLTVRNNNQAEIKSTDTALDVASAGNGLVDVANRGTIDVSGAGAGLRTDTINNSRTANHSVFNEGSIATVSGVGVFSRASGSGNYRFENASTGLINSTNAANAVQINTNQFSHSGLTEVVNAGGIFAPTGNGIFVEGAAATGNVEVTHSGRINAGSRGINVVSGTNGTIKVAVTANGNSNDEIRTTNASGHGIAIDAAQGASDIDISIGANSIVSTQGGGAAGVYIDATNTGASTSLYKVQLDGTINTLVSTTGNGIFALTKQLQTGTNVNLGSVTVGGTGVINTNGGSGIELAAVDNGNGALGASASVTLDAGSVVSSSNGFGVRENDALGNSVKLATTLDVGGTLSGATAAISLAGGDDTVTLRNTSTVTGLIDGGADTDSLTFEYSSDRSQDPTQITNFETLTKTQAGKLEFTAGTNTDMMALALNGGSVFNNGTLTNTSITAASGTTIGGAGTFGGITLNGATLAPGNSIGVLTTSGNVTFGANSTYAVEVDAAGNSDRLDAGGTVTISGTGTTLSVSGPNVIYPTGTNSYRVINATGGVTGQFATVTDSIPDIDFNARYSANTVDIEYTKAGAGGGTTGGGTTGGGTTGGSTGGGTTGGGTTGGGTTGGGTVTVNNGGLSSKSIYAANGASSLEAGRVFSVALTDRATSGLVTPLPSAQPLGYWGSDLLAQGGSAPSNGAFGGAVGSFTNVKASNGNAGYSTSIGGIYVGVERAASFDMGDVLLGISAGYSLGSVQSANDSANSRFGNIGAYGAVSNDGWLVAGSASFAFGSFDTKRLLNVGGGTVTASNDLGATVFSTDFEVSYDIAPELGYANASIRPYGRINANFASLQGGTETGAGILNLTVNGTNASQIFAETGTKISTVITEGDITWRPEVGLGYRYLLSERGLVSASQLAVVGANFTSTVARRNRSNIVASAGISWEKDNLSGHATYEGSFSGNAIDNKLSAGIEIGF